MFGIGALEDAEHIELLITRVGFRPDAQWRGLGANGAAQATGYQGSVCCVPSGSGLYRGPGRLYRPAKRSHIRAMTSVARDGPQAEAKALRRGPEGVPDEAQRTELVRQFIEGTLAKD